MKKLQMLAVLILSLFFVISCASDEDDEFWDEDQTDTYSGGNSGGDNTDTSEETLPENQQNTGDDTSDSGHDNTDTADSGMPDNDPSDSQTDNDSDTQTPDSDTETPDSDTTPAPDNDTETPDSDTTPAPTEEEKCQTAGGTYANNTCTKTAECAEKPANTEWNGESSYTQNYTNGAWSAETTTEYNSEEAGACHYKCAEGYFWNESACVNPCDDPDPCGDNAVENSCEAVDATTVTCNCEEGYQWVDDKCSNTRTVECTKPELAKWNTETAPTIEQTWTKDGETENWDWSPSTESEYDPDKTEGCYFSCKENYDWTVAIEIGKCLPECSSTSGAPCKDSIRQIIWSQRSGTTYTLKNDKARSYCETLDEGGYPVGSWRLPTIDELRTLIQNCEKAEFGGECKVSDPGCLLTGTDCYDALKCNNQNICKSNSDGSHSKLGDNQNLWSSSQGSNDSTYAFVGMFLYGTVGKSKIAEAYYVRCVIKEDKSDNGTEDPGDGNDEQNP